MEMLGRNIKFCRDAVLEAFQTARGRSKNRFESRVFRMADKLSQFRTLSSMLKCWETRRSA